MPSLLWSADPCPDCQVDTVIDDVSGGLATSIPPHKLDKGYSPNMRNMFIDNDTMEQINGFIQIGSTNTLRGGYEIDPYYLEDGSSLFLVNDSSVVLETADYQTYVFVSSGHNPGVKMRCKQIENKMWCSNGVDSVFTWNHTVKTILDGTKGTPNVPKGKYIGYYDFRVWMYNIPSDASVAYFSAVKSTNGPIISPDNFLAWPADQFVPVGKGDGQLGTAIWKENGQLKFGKERSIYTLFGTNPTSYLPRLSNPSVGVASHDSVVMLDNQSRFVGHDGIYRGEVRKSDLIEDESDAIVRSGVQTLSNLWESQADFARGQFFGTTATAAGILRPMIDTRNVPTVSPFGVPNFLGSGGPFTLNAGTTFFGPARLNFTGVIDNREILYVQKITGLQITNNGQTVLPQVNVTLTNNFTGVSVTSNIAVNQQVGSQSEIPYGFTNQLFEGWQVNQSSFLMKFEFTNSGASGGNVQIANLSFIAVMSPSTTGQFISEVSTLSMVTAWGNFDSLYNTNGGNIPFYFRASTSLVNLTTQTWATIVPGTIIGVPTANRFIQWASTINSVSSFTNVSNIDNVEIVHIEGSGALNRAFATNWRGRYWLAVSTSADPISSFLLVGSKITNKNPDAWMPISGINIRSIANDAEKTLYAGSASTGAFYRLDFGDNFNGAPISSFYDTPDVYFDSLYKEKSLFEYYLVAQENMGSSFDLGLSVDGGAVTDTTYSLDGSDVLNRSISNVRAKGKYFRWRFSHDIYDEPFKVHNFAVRYQPTGVRKGIND